jgi:GDP-L-fucose synthase
MNKNDKIYIAGHNGLVGSAILRLLHKEGYNNLVLRSHEDLDLTNQAAVMEFFRLEKPEYIFLAAAKVGGIYANSRYPADFIRDNILIQANIIDSAYKNNAKKLQFLGSSCIYPKFAPQPMKEEYLLTGELEPTNEWYAIAKISGIKMCQAYRKQYNFNTIALMPTNLYGPGDNFDLEGSHVLPALIRKFHEAKMKNLPKVVIWGTGTPRREFLFVDDLAEAAFFLMEKYDEGEIINVGTGKDISIKEIGLLIKEIIGYQGEIVFDTSMPDGTPRKLLDISKISDLGFLPKTSLRKGIETTYKWFLENQYSSLK